MTGKNCNKELCKALGFKVKPNKKAKKKSNKRPR